MMFSRMDCEKSTGSCTLNKEPREKTSRETGEDPGGLADIADASAQGGNLKVADILGLQGDWQEEH